MSDHLSLRQLKGIGPSREKALKHRGIETIEDLLYLFPRRYEDRRSFSTIHQLKAGQWVSVKGKIIKKKLKKTFMKNKGLVEIHIEDETSTLICLWFNQPYLEHVFHVDDEVIVYGKVESYRQTLQMVSPEYELIDSKEDSLHMGRIVPIYSLTQGLSQKTLRRLMQEAIHHFADHIPDILPEGIVNRQKLLSLKEGLSMIHFPNDESQKQKAMERVSFDEFFIFQIAVRLRRLFLKKQKGFVHFLEKPFEKRFLESLPFDLTSSQKKVLQEIVLDMKQPLPMLRLLQGDVGSGKTIMAFLGCMASVVSGYQSAFLAPTEILARQQYEAFQKIFSKGLFGEIRVGLFTSATPQKEKEKILKQIKNGDLDIVFGTHALLQDNVRFAHLSFVAIDEQHKFGVKQRALLTLQKQPPDVLVMTATPIPRSLSLTLYGDLDFSLIEEKPKNRGQVKTYYVSSKDADGIYQQVVEWVQKGTQAYLVYPIIEETQTQDLKSVVEMYKELQKKVFQKFRLGLIHGRLPKDEVEQVMKDFKEQKIDILFTTTILEVGIDVPTANVMVIEHAERFGLAQLHQLRGRIGRSEKNAICVLIANPKTPESEQRIKALLASHDGFQIAQQDLEIRGPGQYFGRYQHGLNELAMINPVAQQDILRRAREEAEQLLTQDFSLKKNPFILQWLKRAYPEYLDYLRSG